MIFGVMITYNDFPLVQKTVESMSFCDQIIAVDGRFIDFPGDTQHSTDGTLEYLQSVEKVSLVLAPPLLEHEKRNLYLVGSQDDWYFHLDADEEYKGSFGLPDADMGIFLLRRSVPVHTMDRVRLWRHVPGLHYAKKHYWLHDSKGRTFSLLEKPGDNYTAARMPGEIIHWGEERPPERRGPKRAYYRILSKRENAIKEVR